MDSETNELFKKNTAASLASGVIASMGNPVTIEDALEIFNDCYFTLFPDQNNGRYNTWKSDRALRKLPKHNSG